MSHKENRIRPETKDNVLCADIGSRISLADYQTIFEPEINRILTKYEKICVVLVYNDTSLSWDLDAAARDLEQMTRLGRMVEKVALVNPPELVITRWSTLRPLLGGELRLFKSGELNEALAWAKAE